MKEYYVIRVVFIKRNEYGYMTDHHSITGVRNYAQKFDKVEAELIIQGINFAIDFYGIDNTPYAYIEKY